MGAVAKTLYSWESPVLFEEVIFFLLYTLFGFDFELMVL